VLTTYLNVLVTNSWNDPCKTSCQKGSIGLYYQISNSSNCNSSSQYSILDINTAEFPSKSQNSKTNFKWWIIVTYSFSVIFLTRYSWYFNISVQFLSHSLLTHFKIGCHSIFHSNTFYVSLTVLPKGYAFFRSGNVVSLISFIGHISDPSFPLYKGLPFYQLTSRYWIFKVITWFSSFTLTRTAHLTRLQHLNNSYLLSINHRDYDCCNSWSSEWNISIKWGSMPSLTMSGRCIKTRPINPKDQGAKQGKKI